MNMDGYYCRNCSCFLAFEYDMQYVSRCYGCHTNYPAQFRRFVGNQQWQVHNPLPVPVFGARGRGLPGINYNGPPGLGTPTGGRGHSLLTLHTAPHIPATTEHHGWSQHNQGQPADHNWTFSQRQQNWEQFEDDPTENAVPSQGQGGMYNVHIHRPPDETHVNMVEGSYSDQQQDMYGQQVNRDGHAIRNQSTDKSETRSREIESETIGGSPKESSSKTTESETTGIDHISRTESGNQSPENETETIGGSSPKESSSQTTESETIDHISRTESGNQSPENETQAPRKDGGLQPSGNQKESSPKKVSTKTTPEKDKEGTIFDSRPENNDVPKPSHPLEDTFKEQGSDGAEAMDVNANEHDEPAPISPNGAQKRKEMETPLTSGQDSDNTAENKRQKEDSNREEMVFGGGKPYNKNEQPLKDYVKPTTRSTTRSQQEAQRDEDIAVDFHVVVSPEFKIDPNQDAVYIRFRDDELGGFHRSVWKMEFHRVLPGANMYKMMHLVVAIPKRSLHNERHLEYKYVVHRKKKKVPTATLR